MTAVLGAMIGCRSSQPTRVGSMAPDFSVSDGRRSVRLSELRGRPVLLNFWATWCPPCVQEVPSLVELQRRMGDRLTVVAVSMDVDDGAFQSFTSRHMPGVLAVRDGEHRSSSIYGTFAYPESFLIDRDGKIVRHFVGAVDWNSPEILELMNRL